MADDLTGEIIGAAIEAHKHPGPGLLESIYQTALCHEFEPRQILYERQRCTDIVYKDMHIKGQRIDLVAGNEVIVELKVVIQLHRIFLSQTLSYLKGSGVRQASIFNFGERRLVDGIKRVSL